MNTAFVTQKRCAFDTWSQPVWRRVKQHPRVGLWNRQENLTTEMISHGMPQRRVHWGRLLQEICPLQPMSLKKYVNELQKERNNTMWPFMIPLYIDTMGHLTNTIPHVNHNALNPSIVHEICNNICGNRLGVKNKHENKCGNDMSCFLVYYNKVCFSNIV